MRAKMVTEIWPFCANGSPSSKDGKVSHVALLRDDVSVRTGIHIQS